MCYPFLTTIVPFNSISILSRIVESGRVAIESQDWEGVGGRTTGLDPLGGVGGGEGGCTPQYWMPPNKEIDTDCPTHAF